MVHRLFLIFATIFFLSSEVCRSTLGAESVIAQPQQQALETVQESLKPGSLIFHRGKCLTVKLYTWSPFTHVAIAMPKPGSSGWIVYDSARRHGVRKSELGDYLLESSPDALFLLHPRHELKASQQEKLRKALEEQLGRPYSVKQHLTGTRARGVHCSEYVTDALMAIDLLHAHKPPRVSPASLLEGIVQESVYRPDLTLKVELPVSPASKTETWCRQIWDETRTCTGRCYRKMKRLVPSRSQAGRNSVNSIFIEPGHSSGP